MKNSDQEKFLREKANQIRREVISVAVANGAGHIAPSLSCVDILVALYYGVMKYDAQNPGWEGRDRLIFSKSHGCYALYAILADMGLIPQKIWQGLYQPSNPLSGCAERKPDWGIEAGCGSLGHGLPIAVGVALGASLQNKSYHTFCVVGDGELQEGTTWEAVQFAVKHGLDNLTIIVDNNHLQAMDFVVNVLDRKENEFIARLEGFGLSCVECPGHAASQLAETIRESFSMRNDGPGVVVAETTKGYGLSCMENVPKFHFRIPTEQEMREGILHE